MERIDNFISKGQAVADVSTHLQPTGRNTYAWMTEDLNKTGAVGDASQATSCRANLKQMQAQLSQDGQPRQAKQRNAKYHKAMQSIKRECL